jgi:hypothetical protein
MAPSRIWPFLICDKATSGEAPRARQTMTNNRSCVIHVREAIIARLPASVRGEAGERVGVQINPDGLHLLDQDTEVAV